MCEKQEAFTGFFCKIKHTHPLQPDIADEIEKIAKENYSAAKLQNKWYECINFALYLLDEKIESENIYILAGLDSDDYDNINKYFFAVINELKIVKMDEDINYNFLCYLGRKVHNDEIEAIYALTILEKMYYQTSDKRFWEWVEFGDAIDLLEDGITYYKYDINKDNLCDYIKEKILLDIDLYKEQLPDNFFKMAFCEKCNKLVIPEIKKTLFRKKFFYKCNNCKATSKFLWCLDNKGKNLYLERKNSPNTRFNLTFVLHIELFL